MFRLTLSNNKITDLPPAVANLGIYLFYLSVYLSIFQNELQTISLMKLIKRKSTARYEF